MAVSHALVDSDASTEATLPALLDVLDLPPVRSTRPEVLAGADRLDRPVNRVHVSERADDAEQLDGGEMLLTTGVGLTNSDGSLTEFAEALAKAEAAGLVVELGRCFTRLPAALVETCRGVGLPLISLQPGASFVRITQAVDVLVAEHRMSVLQTSDHARETFTRMCIEGASATDIVVELSRLTQCPVVFENLVHQVLAYAPTDTSAQQLLDRWESRSRDASVGNDLGAYGPEGWLTAWVEVKGRTWGRLVILPHGQGSQAQAIALRRAATALALNRLLEQNESTLERQAHRSTLTDIIEHRFRSRSQMHAHTAALGVPTKDRSLVAVIVDIMGVSPTGPGAQESAAETIASALSRSSVPALVADLRPARIGVLVSLGVGVDRKKTLTRFAKDLKKHCRQWADSQPIIAVGSAVSDIEQVARSFTEAHQVADAAVGASTEKLYYELPDIQLRGLLHLLGDDPRLQSFVERTLGNLLDFDRRNESALVDTLRTFLLHGGNKSAAAEASHVARQTFYRRLATVQRILSMDLSSAEVRTSLHAAIMALEAQRSTRGKSQLGRPGTEVDRQVYREAERANAELAW